MEELDIDYIEIDWRATPADKVLEQINSQELDLLIWGLQDPFERPNIMKAAKAKRRAFWGADLRDERTGGFPNKYLRDVVDFTMQSNAGLLELWEKHTGVPSYYVGQAGFEGKRIESKHMNLDVVFIGGRINSGFLGQRFHLMKEIHHPITHLNEDTLPKRMQLYAEMPTIYSTAKICFDSSQVWDIEKYCSARYFHIAANGGFSICKRFPGCEDLFPEGVGKMYFDTATEATNLLRYYSRSGAGPERKKIAELGQKHALAYHTYTNRIHDICQLL